jgi:hypothetical protein
MIGTSKRRCFAGRDDAELSEASEASEASAMAF